MELWDKHKSYKAPNSHPASDYSVLCSDNLIIFEFFMPLSNEANLRNSLDALFYRDSVLKRLKSLDPAELENFFPKSAEDSDEWLEGICSWVSSKFSGYSISHVSGRYRSRALCTMKEAYKLLEDGGSYLIDETTAVARFIFPSGESRIIEDLSFEADASAAGMTAPQELEREYCKIRYLFFKLFIQNIVEIVSEEDEIWMMESGMKNRLYSWKVRH